MNYEFQYNQNFPQNKNIILTQQTTTTKNNNIINNYFNANIKRISPSNNQSENMNNIYHSIKFKGKNDKNEEIKNHDPYNDYDEKNNKKYFLINQSPPNFYLNKYNMINTKQQKFQHNISPIKINLFLNNKSSNSERKPNRINFDDIKQRFITQKKDFNNYNRDFNDDNNNSLPHIPINDTCIESFENSIIKKNNLNIIPIPKKMKALNDEIRKNLFYENKIQNNNKFNNYYSPPRINRQNIDINMDYYNEKTLNPEIKNSPSFNNIQNTNFTPKNKYYFNYNNSPIKFKIKSDNKNFNSKKEFPRQLNIRVKKLKYINNDDFKIFWSGKSKAGKDKNGKIKTNQDAFRVCENINNIKNFNFYILCDGHGKDGHYVSKYITQNITSKITTHSSILHLKNTEEIYQTLIKDDYKLIKDIFSQIDIYLSLQKNFDTYKSGSTCVLIIQIGPKIICANIGDSRAIMVYSNNQNLFGTKIFPLSLDSKPDLPSELSRIINSGGVVHKKINNKGQYVGPMRVFAKGKDFPGLAMSRSFGDFQCKEYGVISEPSFVEYCLDENCKYLVLGSDGVWDFLDNENVVKIGNKYYLKNNPKGFCNEILENASYWWEKEDNVVDDITALIIFFKFFV